MNRQITINIPQEDFEKIQKAAKVTQRSKSGFIRYFVILNAEKILSQQEAISA